MSHSSAEKYYQHNEPTNGETPEKAKTDNVP
jgi:hypothetical protein